MCGLAGVAGNYISKDHFAAFQQLLYCSAVRGWDATGVAAVFKEKDAIGWDVQKSVGPAQDLIFTKEFQDIYSKRFDLRVLIGHCRAATVGDNKVQNAHPFEFEHVVGAHNGTLIRRPPNQKLFDTDSEALYARINESGVIEAIPEVTGAWALTWYDNFQKTLNFLRNDQRELYVAALKHTDTIFWASESGLLEWVLRRQRLDIDTLIKLKPDLHISFKVFESRWFETLEQTEVKGGKPETSFFRGTSVPFVPETKATSPPSTDSSSNVVPLVERKTPRAAARIRYRKGWKGEEFDEQAYNVMLSIGCAYCGTIEDAKSPHRWVSRDSYLCSECKEDWHVSSIAIN